VIEHVIVAALGAAAARRERGNHFQGRDHKPPADTQPVCDISVRVGIVGVVG
jgi:hypothetical protein